VRLPNGLLKALLALTAAASKTNCLAFGLFQKPPAFPRPTEATGGDLSDNPSLFTRSETEQREVKVFTTRVGHCRAAVALLLAAALPLSVQAKDMRATAWEKSPAVAPSASPSWLW
jgi:hypothetical protein